MGRYIKVADREASEAKDRLRSGLQKIADDPNSTNAEKLEALSRLTDIHISEEKAEARSGPLKDEIAEQAKELRVLKKQLEVVNAATTEAQARIGVLEKENAGLTQERDGLQNDVARLGSAVTNSRSEAIAADARTRNVEMQSAGAKVELEKLKVSVATLAKFANVTDGFVEEMFFKQFDQLSQEVFLAFGWTRDKIDFYSGWFKRTRNVPNEPLIDKLHRVDCACTSHGGIPTTVKDESGVRPITPKDEEFFTALLKVRGVNVELELTKLRAEHMEDYRKKNRPHLQYTPPLSHREITPVASGQVVRWGQD